MGNKCQQQYYYYQECKPSKKQRREVQYYSNCQPVQYNCQPTQVCADSFTPSTPKINNLEISKPADNVKDHYDKVITFETKAGENPSILYSGSSKDRTSTFNAYNGTMCNGTTSIDNFATQIIKKTITDPKTGECKDVYTIGVKKGWDINFRIAGQDITYNAPFTETAVQTQAQAVTTPEAPDPMGIEPAQPVQPAQPIQPAQPVQPAVQINPPTKIEVASGRANSINAKLLDLIEKEHTPGSLYGKNPTALGKDLTAIKDEFQTFIKDGMERTNPFAMDYLAGKLRIALIKHPSTDNDRNKIVNDIISSLRKLSPQLKEITPRAGGEIITNFTVEDGTFNPNDSYKITNATNGIEIKADDRNTSRNEWQKGLTKKLETAKDWKSFDHALMEYIKKDDGNVTFTFVGK